MNARTQRAGEVRMMGVKELSTYLSVGSGMAAEFGKECGAERKIGRRVLYDKKIIDAALDTMSA